MYSTLRVGFGLLPPDTVVGSKRRDLERSADAWRHDLNLKRHLSKPACLPDFLAVRHQPAGLSASDPSACEVPMVR